MKKLYYVIISVCSLALCGCTNFGRLYNQERKAELERTNAMINEKTITEEDIAHLPSPVIRYFRNCGYIDTPYIYHADTIWEKSYIRLKPEAKWMNMHTRQFNSIPNPMRLAHMKTKVMGLFPMEGRDKSADGEGHMYGKIMGLFTVFDAKDLQISQSALITIFAETLFFPTYALQDYISWEAVDELTAIARISYRGLDAEGIFHFDEDGTLARFETNDRYYALPNGDYTKYPWFCEIESYKQQGALLIPEIVSANWDIDGEVFCYWKGQISEIKYNALK